MLKVFSFADDTKLTDEITSNDDCHNLQEGLDAMNQWRIENKLLFNVSKCAVLCFPASSGKLAYTLNNCTLPIVESQRDLGVVISNNLCWTVQYQASIAKANKQLGLLKRTFGRSAAVETRKALYVTLVRSQLTYCSQIWRPYLVKDIIILEKVQRRSTKFILHNTNLTYKERLQSLNLLPLMMWYEVADVMFFLKEVKNPSQRFNIFNYVNFSSTAMRSSSQTKLRHTRSRTNCFRHFYFNRLPRLWNSLPPLDISLSLISLHSKIVEIFWNHFNVNFISDNPCTYHYKCPCARCIYTPPCLNPLN